MDPTYDAIVIGAGHNGLVTASYLAKAGQRVIVVERRDVVGGAALTEESYPGFAFETAAHRINRLHPTVSRDLQAAIRSSASSGLSQTYGDLEMVALDPAVFAPLLEGDHLMLWRSPERTREEIGRFSQRDAEKWPAFRALIASATSFLSSLYDAAPPNFLSSRPAEIWEVLVAARRLRGLGAGTMREVTRVLTMTVRELLDEWFETDVLKGTLGAAGITGIFQGPMAAGTALMFLHQNMGAEDGAPRHATLVRGGVGRLSRALEAFALQHGAEIRRDAEVERVLVEKGRVHGVRLANGGSVRAATIASSADPKRTFLDLVDPHHLDPSFVRQIRNIKFKGICAKVNLALSELPHFRGLPETGAHQHGLISISPSLTYLERAFDDAKYGAISRAPYLEALIPSLHDSSLAPAGQHVMSILAQYAPYNLEGGWDDSRRQQLGDLVVRTLTRYAPNLAETVLHRQVLTPRDFETQFGLSEGNIYHGEMTLDQLLFMRPVAGWAQYRTPIEGLYLCGAGAHPGGGITGAPGYNAAREILRNR